MHAIAESIAGAAGGGHSLDSEIVRKLKERRIRYIAHLPLSNSMESKRFLEEHGYSEEAVLSWFGKEI